MQNLDSQPYSDSIRKAMKVYRFFIIEMVVIILFVFFEPTFRRIAEGDWIRGRFNFVWTLSLDAHAVIAYLFLFLFILQFIIGYRQFKKPRLKKSHARLGNFLFYVVIPLFVIAGVWVILDRIINISPEDSVNFRRYRGIILIGLLEILFFFSWYTIRSIVAIKRKDIPMHLDSAFAAFMMGGTVGVIRFMYAIFWAIRGGSPFSVAGMFFITMAVVAVHLFLGHFLSGRLRQNLVPLLAMVGATLLLAVLGANHYVFLDIP